ncbi:MAG TPA: ABC transporter permease [Kofleriaceae bacterium]|nr:ABC transporter permease [Kofleriaceae bacterium]
MFPRYFYYVDLALRSFRRNRVLTGLMVVAIALGIGASMTTLTVLYLLSGDPLPGKSETIYAVQLDSHGPEGYRPGEEPDTQLTRFDAETLLRARRADRQAMMSGGNVAIEPKRAGLDPFYADARYTSADFFPMFEVPFAQGAGWSAAEDAGRARIAVISSELNEKLFGGENGVGRTIRLEQSEFRVVGVLGRWRPTPHFYDLNTGSYGEAEQVFVPFSTARELDFSRSGTMNCWSETEGEPEGPNAPCSWIQFWVQLGSRDQASAYRDYLVSYSEQQRKAGRFTRPPNVRLRDVMQWLDARHVVPSDVRLQTWLAFGFLMVCLLNTIGLLLAKFLRRSQEIGVRRALGASRRAVFTQFLVEAGTVGLVGGILGLGLAWLGLWAVRHQPTEYAALAHLDLYMLGATFVLAIASSLLAGLLPAWRACQVTPALQLKSQ